MSSDGSMKGLWSEAHAIEDCLVYLHRHCVKLELTTTAYLIDVAHRSVSDSVKQIESGRGAERRNTGDASPALAPGANDP
jgi:hypothetical protein